VIETERITEAVQVFAPYFVAIIESDSHKRAVKGW